MHRAIRYASTLAFFTSLASAGAPAHAGTPWVFKHDKFPASISGVIGSLNGTQANTQPAFVAGEAFGQIYSPTPEMYPVNLTGFDLILAGPPLAVPGTNYNADATIEIYNSTTNGADPGVAPIFTISTDELMNRATGQIGVPLVGNMALQVDFDMTEVANHPPLITQGKIWVVIRFQDDPKPYSEWGTNMLGFDVCATEVTIPEVGTFPTGACGCQTVGTIHDDDGLVPHTNVLNIVWPLGQCSGSKQWKFMDDPAIVTSSGFTIPGDIILRLKADVADAPCVPACGGLECGSDGCGGSCGPCGADERCHEGQCVVCVADCNGKECGDNGCGGTCGNCKTDEVCSAYQCEAQCTPSCAGRECGNNGCGGTCGSCEAGEQCVNGGCEQACVPACSGRECGDDSCGGTCGSCTGGKSCNAGGFCVAGCVPSCSGRDCGDDGCGGSCGTCTVGVCSNGMCGPDCEPACDGKSCGNDGCGGNCGTCEGGQTCSDAGACVTGEGTFEVLDISPDFGLAGAPVAVSITGHGFVAGASAKLGAVALTEVVVTGSSLLSATVPGTLAPGKYTVIVVNPDGGLAQKIDGFEVRSALTTGNGNSGCETGGAGTGLGFAMMAVAGAMWAQRRRGH